MKLENEYKCKTFEVTFSMKHLSYQVEAENEDQAEERALEEMQDDIMGDVRSIIRDTMIEEVD